MEPPIGNLNPLDSIFPPSTKPRPRRSLQELFQSGLEKKSRISTSGVSKMSGPLVEVVTVPKPKKCSRCANVVRADGTAVIVNSVFFCKGCAFDVVKELPNGT